MSFTRLQSAEDLCYYLTEISDDIIISILIDNFKVRPSA